MVPQVQIVRVENHVVNCLRVERFFDFRVRRETDVQKDGEEEDEVEERVCEKDAPHWCCSWRCSFARFTADGASRTFFLLSTRTPKISRISLSSFLGATARVGGRVLAGCFPSQLPVHDFLSFL